MWVRPICAFALSLCLHGECVCVTVDAEFAHNMTALVPICDLLQVRDTMPLLRVPHPHILRQFLSPFRSLFSFLVTVFCWQQFRGSWRCHACQLQRRLSSVVRLCRCYIRWVAWTWPWSWPWMWWTGWNLVRDREIDLLLLLLFPLSRWQQNQVATGYCVLLWQIAGLCCTNMTLVVIFQ